MVIHETRSQEHSRSAFDLESDCFRTGVFFGPVLEATSSAEGLRAIPFDVLMSSSGGCDRRAGVRIGSATSGAEKRAKEVGPSASWDRAKLVQLQRSPSATDVES